MIEKATAHAAKLSKSASAKPKAVTPVTWNHEKDMALAEAVKDWMVDGGPNGVGDGKIKWKAAKNVHCLFISL